jgi:hypothetical protein
MKPGLEPKQSSTAEVMMKIHGVPLNGHRDGFFFPVRPCICVIGENCPCDVLDDLIVWLPEGTPGEKTGKQNTGHDVVCFTVPRAAKVLVETRIPITARHFERMGEVAAARGRSVVFQTKGKAPSKTDLIVGAFAVGWEIGTFIDEKTGISDAISDWAAENIPWPF